MVNKHITESSHSSHRQNPQPAQENIFIQKGAIQHSHNTKQKHHLSSHQTVQMTVSLNFLLCTLNTHLEIKISQIPQFLFKLTKGQRLDKNLNFEAPSPSKYKKFDENDKLFSKRRNVEVDNIQVSEKRATRKIPDRTRHIYLSNS